MLPGIRLRIGGVDLVVHAPPGAQLRMPHDFHEGFRRDPDADETGSCVPVRVVCDEHPLFQDKRKLFDTRGSWSAFRDEDGYWLTLQPGGQKERGWIAHFDPGVTRLELYCNCDPPDPRGRRVIDLPLTYPLDQLFLMHYFARRRGMLVHSAGMMEKGRAYLFAGVSGAGKSTFSQLLEEAGAGTVLSDERMIVREIHGSMVAFGTPWAGTAAIARPGRAALAGLFFLQHGKDNAIRPLSAAEAADRLLPMISIPWYDPDIAAAIIAFVKHLAAAAPVFEMRFTPDRAAVDCLEAFLSGHSRSAAREDASGRRFPRG